MAEKEIPQAKRKIRAESYEEKVHFDGTLEQMIKIAAKPIKPKPKENNENGGVRGG